MDAVVSEKGPIWHGLWVFQTQNNHLQANTEKSCLHRERPRPWAPDPAPFKSLQHLPPLASPGGPGNQILYPSNQRRCLVLQQPPCHGAAERLGCFLGPSAHAVPEPVSLRGGELGKGAAWRAPPPPAGRKLGQGPLLSLILSPFPVPSFLSFFRTLTLLFISYDSCGLLLFGLLRLSLSSYDS